MFDIPKKKKGIIVKLIKLNTREIFFHAQHELQSEQVFPHPFDWQDIIGLDHRLFFKQSVANSDDSSFYQPIPIELFLFKKSFLMT